MSDLRGRNQGALVFVMAAVIVAACSTGCEYIEPKDRYEGPVVPDIAGEWKGSYYFLEFDRRAGEELVSFSKAHKRGERSITAVVALDEANHTYVTLTTSRSGRGHYLSGRIDSGGNMRMVDAYDGETWTTHRRRATATLIELNDIVYADEYHEGVDQGLMTILLDEHVPAPPEEETSLSYFEM